MTSYPTKSEAIRQMIDIGRRMYEKGFVAANDGNISCRLGEGRIIATPTGVSKGFMAEEMMLEMDMDGNTITQSGKFRPTSEIKMHLRAYLENPDIVAVAHAHPPISTSFAVAGIALDTAILTEAAVSLGCIYVAPYAPPGSQGVPDSIAPYVRDYNGVLLANHGALTWGRDLTEAWFRLESLEHYAHIAMNTYHIIGRASTLTKSQVGELMEIRGSLGIKTGGTPRGAEDLQS